VSAVVIKSRRRGTCPERMRRSPGGVEGRQEVLVNASHFVEARDLKLLLTRGATDGRIIKATAKPFFRGYWGAEGIESLVDASEGGPSSRGVFGPTLQGEKFGLGNDH